MESFGATAAAADVRPALSPPPNPTHPPTHPPTLTLTLPNLPPRQSGVPEPLPANWVELPIFYNTVTG